MRPITGGVCTVCGERLFSSYVFDGAPGEPRCGLCRRTEQPFARAAAYGSYESGLRELIHLLKFGGVRPAANVLGRMLAEALATLESEFPSDSMAVIAVPLHRTKLRQRGFNQAELIARAAIKIKQPGIVCVCAREFSRESAKPHRRSASPATSAARTCGVAFGVTQPELVKGREVLVVDDVYTTGATVSECARVLSRAGATRVWVATVARTLKISAQHVEIGLCSGNGEIDKSIEAERVPMAKAVGI